MNKRDIAFTLIELMIVVIIIGLLASLAMPAYKAYIINAKKAEAYQTLGVMRKYQESYRIENNQFYTLTSNGRGSHGETGFVQRPAWDEVGYSIPVGQQTYFAYAAHAGKFDESGTALISGNNTSRLGLYPSNIAMIFMAESLMYLGDGTRECNSNTSSPEDFGVNGSPGAAYDWVIVAAKANLTPGVIAPCTVVMMIVENAANGVATASKGMIEFKVE